MAAPMPDLSHLSEDEKKIILAVIEKQQAEEKKDAAVIRQLKDDLENYQKSVKQLDEETKQRGPQQSGAVCQICHKTKFADGVGHSCNYCQMKSCARCGGRVTLRSNKTLWVCNICRKKQEILTKSGQWIAPDSKGKSPDSGTETASQVSTKDQEALKRVNAEGSRGSDKENIPKGAHPPPGPRGRELKRQYSMNKDETRRERTLDNRDPRDMRGDPRDMRGNPRDMRGDPRDMRGDPRRPEHWRGSHGSINSQKDYDERTRGHPRSSSRHPADDAQYYSDNSDRQYPINSRDHRYRHPDRYPDGRGRRSDKDRYPPERGRSYTPDRDRLRYPERDRFSDSEQSYTDERLVGRSYSERNIDEHGYAEHRRRYDRHSSELEKNRRPVDGMPDRPPSAHSDTQPPNSRYLERRLSDSVSQSDPDFTRSGRDRSSMRMQHEQQQQERERQREQRQLEREQRQREQQQQEMERQRQAEIELEHQRQLEIEHQQELQRQQELERQHEIEQRELERQRQRELEQRELERQRQRELEQRELERQRQRELEQRELERQRQRELEQRELERQRQLELERQRQIEADHQRQAEIERQRQIQSERQRQIELDHQRQNEIDRQRQIEMDHKRQIELDRKRQGELERQRQGELDRQRQIELDRQRQIELDRQRQLGVDRQRQELERQRSVERDRQRTNDIPRPSSSERDRLGRSPLSDYPKHSEHSPMGRNPSMVHTPRPSPRQSITIIEDAKKKKVPTATLR